MTVQLEPRPTQSRRRVSRVRTIAELFFHRLTQSVYARGWEKHRGLRWTRLARLARQQHAFGIETLEPRLLLSANLTYPELSLVTDMTLVAVLDGSDAKLELRETGNPGNVLDSEVLNAALENEVIIQRGGSDTVRDIAGDTIRIDLDSFDLPALAAFIGAGTLDIDFIGGKDISFLEGIIPGIGNDKVRLEGTGPTSIGFDLSVHSSSDIEIDAGTFTLTGSNDLTVESDSTIHMTDTILAAHDVTLAAGKVIPDVVGDADSLDFLQLPSAEVRLENSSISGHDLDITALSKETVTINAAEAFDGALSFAELLLISDATVTVDNTDLTATGTLHVGAESNVTGTLEKKPDDGTEDGSTSTDAAVAVAIVHPDVTVDILNSSVLTSTGITTITGLNKVILTTDADGTLGNDSTGGAVVAVSVVVGDTEVTVDGSTVSGSAVTVSATTDWKIDTSAKASFKGSTNGDNNQESEKRTSDPDQDGDDSDKASTSDGNIEFAATVAVTVETGHTWATIDDSSITAMAGAIAVTASSKHDVSTIADGSTTDDAAPGVGVGVGIGIHIVEAKAWVAGGSTLDATGGATLSAIMPASTFDVLAKSGASGGSSGLGVAAAFAMNITLANVYARVDPSATVDLNGHDLSLVAQSTTDVSAKAEASAGAGDESAGVGASVALNIVDNDTKATIGSNATLTDADDVHLTATADHGVVTEAKGGAEGGTAVAPVVAISIVTLDTATEIKGNALQTALVTGGELTADADGTSDVSTKAEGKATGGDAAVGAAIAFTWAQDTVVSETLRSVTTGGETRFKAKGRAKSLSEAKASAQGAEGEGDDSSGKNAQQKGDDQRGLGNSKAGSKGANSSGTENKASAQNQDNDTVTVAAAIGINITTATARAEIADDLTIDSDGKLTVHASQNVDVTTTADGAVANGGTGIAAAVAVNVGLVTNSARIGDATITADGVFVTADMTDVGSEATDKHSFSAQATSGSAADDISIAGSVAINYSDIDTTASIETGATLNLQDGGDAMTGVGAIDLTATAIAEDVAKALPNEDMDGEGGADTAGVGASFALNLVLHDTTAEMQNGVAVTGTNINHLSAEATGKDTVTTEAKNGAKGEVGVGAAVAVAISENHTTARIGTGGAIDLGGGASEISADHEGIFLTTVASEAEGSDAAVGASVGVVVITDSSTATLARSVDSATGDFTVEAKSKMSSTLDVNASAGGEDSESDNADSKSSGAANNSNVSGNAGTQSTPSASGQTSSASGSASGESGGGSSGVGVAAAVAVNVIVHDNIAQVTNGADIETTGEVKISAQAEVDGSAKALGTAVTLSDSNMIGAAVGVNVATVNNKALVTGASLIEGDGITVEAVTTGSAKNEFVVWGASAAGGTGDVGVAGSVAVGVVTFTTEASAASAAQLVSTGALHITAENEMVYQTIAAGVGFSSGTSVGAAVAVTVITSNTDAFIAGDADAAGLMAISAKTTLAPPPTLNLPDNSGIDDPSIAISSAALAGGGSNGGVGIAGAADISILTVNTHAYIAGSAQINQDGSISGLPAVQSVSVDAESTLTMTNAAGALGISTDSTGVGAGLEVTILTKDTQAYVASGALLDAEGALTVDADSSEDIISIAANAGVGNSVGVAGSGTVQVLTTTTRAYVGGNVGAGNISITADGHLDATMVAGSIGASAGSAGIGASASVLVHNDTVEAYIADNAVVVSGGSTGITIAAASSEDLITLAVAGGGASTAGVAGSAVVNVLNEHTHASVGRSADLTVDNGAPGTPGVSIHAQDDTDIVSVAGNLAVGGTAGVGLGADVAVLSKDTFAYIDSGVTADVEGDIVIGAVATEDITSVAAGMSLSGTASVALDASVHVINNQTRAWIGDDPTGGPASAGPGHVHAGGNVLISADDQTEMDKIVGVLAVSGTAGVAAAGAVSVVNKTTEAFIGAGAVVSGDGNTGDASVADGKFGASFGGGATFDPNNGGDQGVHADSIGSSPDSNTLKSQGEVNTPTLGDMDADSDGSSEATDDAFTGARTLTAGSKSVRGVSVTALNRDDISSFTIAVAGGTAGVAVSAGVNVVSTNTTAYIGAGAQVNTDPGANTAQDVNVAAGNDFYHLAVAGSLGVGVVGVAPAVDITVLSNTTLASIGAGATVKAKDDVVVEAHAHEHIVQVGFGLGGGVVGIGGAVDVMTINNSTTAMIGNATVSADGDVAVFASDETDITMVSGALAGGFVGIGMSVGVMVVNKDTSAFIADGATVDADGADSGYSGILNGGISGGPNESFQTSSVHGVIVQAQSKEDILHLVIAGGAGFVGVSGAVAVTLVDSDTTAFIGNADINTVGGLAGDADQSVFVSASNEAHLTTFVVGIAGGFVGVGGAVDIGSLKNDTSAEIRTGAVVNAENDVDVNAVAIHEVDGFTLSGAGGAVALTAAVSVWSVGTPIQKDYQNDEGTSATATSDGSGGNADSDAGGQAQTSSGQVSGLLGGFSSDGGGNSKTAQNRVDAGTQGAGSSLSSSAPSQASILAAVNSGSASTGTVATIASGAVVTTGVGAGHDIEVTANADTEVDLITGGVAAGAIGVGASIAVLHTGENVSATAGGTLSAGGHLEVKGILHEDVVVTSLSGSVGFVGLGAAVVSISDASTVSAGILNNADVIRASSVLVSANNVQDFHGHSGQLSSGAVGAGAAFVVIDIDNGSATDTRAFIGNNTDIGQAGTVGSVTVTAASTVTGYAQTEALSAGIGAMTGNFAFVDITPEVEATIGTGGHITVTGGISVSATATPYAYATTFGVSLGVGLGAGFSLAQVEASPDVTASAGGHLTASSLTITGAQAVGASGYTARAETRGSSGGILVGIDATISDAEDNGAVHSFVANNAVLDITNATNVQAHNNTRQLADANSNGFGLIAAGISSSDASSDTFTEAYLGSNVTLDGKSLTIIADGTDDNFADTVAGSAGLIAGASASAETGNTSDVEARIGASDDITLTTGSGALTVKAEHTAAFNSRVKALAGGLFAGLGADVENNVDADVKASVGASATVVAKSIDIEAVNHIDKPFLSNANISGTTGGFISGGGADSDTLIALNTQVEIGDFAHLTVTGVVANPGDFILRTQNDILAKDLVEFTAGGALAGLSATTRIETTEDLSRVTIGDNAVLTTIGDLDIFARGEGEVVAHVEAEAFGLATFIAADAVAKVYPHNEIIVNSNATLHAKRDLSLYAGTDTNFNRDEYTMDARSDTFAGSAIPIDDVNSSTVKITFNKITVGAGALLETAGKANLQAEKEGFAHLSGSAKAVSWVSSVQDWLNGAAAALMNDATIFQEGHGEIVMNGTVRTGIERHKELILGAFSGGVFSGWSNTTGEITFFTSQGFDPSEEIFDSTVDVVASDLLQELLIAQEQLNLYGATNPTLKAFYEGEIARITAELQAEGLIDDDPSTPPFPVAQQAIHVHVHPIRAEAGRIDVRADVLSGSGTWDAPSDASVNIVNHTPAFLVIEGILIPDSNGGLYLNGVLMTTNTQIHNANVAVANDDNSRTGPGDTFLATPFPGFGAIPNPSVSDPTIHVINDFVAGHVGPGETYPWPDINIVGDVENLSGLVHLETLPAGEGDINITASVFAETLEIIAGGTVFIDLGDIPGSRFNTGAEPFTQWDPITLGTVPGGGSQLFEGLGNAHDSNDDGVVNGSDTDNDGDTGDLDTIGDVLAKPASPPGVVGDRVYITAEYIENDGLIQSGKDTYSLTLGAATNTEIAGLIAGGASGWVVLSNLELSDDFIVRYDTLSGQILVDDVFTKAGYVDLTGHILNTGNGKIKVLGGYAHVDITNNTGRDLVLYRIDEAQPGDGTLIIKDKAKAAQPNSIFTTLYQQVAGGAVTKVEDSGLGPVANGDTTHYTPNNGWRYGWSVGVETFTRHYYHHDKSAWLGIDILAADPESIAWDTVEVLSAPHILDDGPYYFKDTGIADAYTYETTHFLQDTNEDGTVDSHDNEIYIIDEHVDSTWYGTKTYHHEWKWERRDLHVFTHSIEADRPIDVQFIGATTGEITVNSNAGVLLRGALLNPSGTTTINAAGAILQDGDEALVTGKRIVLSGSSIGTSQIAIDTNVSDVAGASFKATSPSGAIYVNEIFGTLPIDQVRSMQNGLGTGNKVELTANGGIVVADGFTGLIEGGAITLEAGGSIGSLSDFIVLDAGSALEDGLNATALGGVYLSEQDDDLSIESIDATGDVRITVLAGGIVDGNLAETRDERTFDELKDGVWHDLQLTGADAADKVQEAKDSFAALKEQEYQTYWSFRHMQPASPLTLHGVSAPLGGGVKYYAIVNGNEVSLAATSADALGGHAIDIDAVGATGTAHGISVGVAKVFDTRAGFGVDSASDEIRIDGHGFADGDTVTYSKEGSAASIGLIVGKTYYVLVVDADTIQLEATLGGGAVNLTGSATPNNQALYEVRTFAPGDVDNDDDTIDLGPGHGLTTGAVVLYSVKTGDTAVNTRAETAVQAGTTYYIHVVDADHVQLRAVAAGPILDIDNATATGDQHRLDPGGADLSTGLFDPLADVNSASNVITITGHGFAEDQAVVYRSNVFDDTFTVPLTEGEENFYRDELGYNDAQIATLEAARTAQYHVLHQQWGVPYGDGFDAGFAYTLTSQEEATIEANIHVYTEDELWHAISAGLLKDIADTQPTIEEPNISGANVVLTTAHGVGDAVGVLSIDVSGGVHSLTDEERVALSAAERVDVAYLGAGVTVTVDVNAGTHTFTRSSGSWIADGFAHDMRIHVSGSAVNSTDVSEFYLVDTASALVLTLDAGSDLTTESGVALTVTPELDPVGPEATTTVDIDASGRTFTRSTGSWLDDGFAVGQEITVGGSALNSNNVGEHYVIASVTALVLTVGPGLTMTDELGATVNIIAPGGDVQTIVIDKREDVDVEAPGTLDVDAHDSVYVGSEDNSINLGLVETDGAAGADDVRLKSGQAITNADGNGATNVIAGDTILEAANGAIGTAGTPVYLNLTPGGTITGRASTNIYLIERSGDMNVEFMFAQSGSDGVVLKTLNGDIVDALDTDFTKIAANHVKLTAMNGGIGEPGDYLDIDVAGAGTLEADADDDIFIAETFGNMNVHHVKSNTGDVDLKAAISLLDALSSPLPEITGNNITLTAEIGGIGVAGNDVDINSAFSGPGQLTATSLLANAYIIETDGSGPTVDDLTINEVSSGPTFTTFITAPEGSILNGKPNDDPNVISGFTYLIALNNIGASNKPLTTQVGFIEGKSILGSTWVFNYGELTEGGVTDSGDPGMAAGGDVTVSADSPIDVTENIVADNITLNAIDDSADDHLVIHTGFFLKTAIYDFDNPDADATGAVLVAGTITLNAGDSFLLETGAQIVTLGEVFINGDFVVDPEDGSILPGNNDPGLGSVIVVNGTINAPQITITGNDDADDVLIDVNHPTDSLIGHLVILGGDGHDLITVNELHTRHTDIDGVAGFDTVDIDGQGDTDDVVVNVRADAGATDYVINVTDSGAPDDGADTLTINGTDAGDARNPDGEDLFLVRRNFVAYLTEDPSHLPAPDPQHLLAGVERINYDENINGRLIVNAGSGDDRFYTDDNSSITTLDGGAGADFFQIGQVFGTERIPPAVASGDEIASIFTTKGWLSVGVTFPVVVYGGSGNDTMQVYSNKAELRLEGHAGDDTFIIRAFALADPDTGEVLKDLSVQAQAAALGGDGNDLIQYSINAPTDIDGGTGFNRIVVLGTEFSDNFAISEEGIFGAGLHVTYASVQSITVDGLEGNDNFFVLGTPPDVAVNVIGGIGWDTFNVGGDVTLPIVSRDLEGVSGVINHQVTSADLDYDNLPAAGVPLHVATAGSGQIVVQESGGASVVSEAGETEDSYTLSLADTPLADVFITVSAALSPSEAAALGAATLLVSVDGGLTYQSAAVLKFTAGTPAGTTKTVKVKAIDDGAPEGDGLAIVSMSSRSLDADFNHVAIRNVKVEVLDDDQPGLRFTQTDLDTVVLEEDAAAGTHGITDSYTVELATAPAAGQTVTVTLDASDPRLVMSSADPRFSAGTLTFDDTNWNVPATIDLSADQDFVVQNPLIAEIAHDVGGTDAAYTSFFATHPDPELDVRLLDTDGAGVYVRQTDGDTLVVQGDPVGDTYSLRLTSAPAADVTIAFLTDDQTLVDSAVVVPPGGPVFVPAVLDGDGLVIDPATVTFSATNWFTPFFVRVTANPQAPPPPDVQPLKFFPVQPHIVSTAVQGALSIDGSVGPEDRSIKRAVILPTETDPGPLGEVITTDDTGSVDTLNVFNDGSLADDVGTLTGDNLFLEGMGPDLDFLSDDGVTHHLFPKGINYTNVETLEVMLGRGDDDLTIESTMDAPDGTRGALTIVHGGGGGDTITVNGGGGASSPLVVFGDTSEDGSRYVGLSGVASVNAFAFTTHGDDTIDARLATEGLTIFGGRGDDTIWGSQAGDHIAGGSGDDVIHAQGGDDIVYGDDGFNVGKETVTIPEPNQDSGEIDRTLYSRVLVTVHAVSGPNPTPPPDTHDTLTPGADTIFGDGGHDIAFGDFGLVTQTIPETLLSTAGVVKVESKSNADGADDTLRGGDHDDILIGNTGSDAIDGGLDEDLIFGDNVALDRSLTLGDVSNPRFRALSGTQVYSTAVATAGTLLIDSATDYADPRGNAAWADFQVTIQDHTNATAAGLYGDDYIAGGGGDDTIFGELGDDVIQGDGSIDVAFTGGVRVGAFRDGANALVLNPSFDAGTDGHDYIEGNGGSDVVFGNQGQDDIIGGSSTLFSLGVSSSQRPDGADAIFGGSGLSGRNDLGDTSAQGHANDADAIVGDNGNVYRLIGVNGGPGGAPTSGGFLAFNYDDYDASAKIVARGVRLVDYTPGGPDYAGQAGPMVTGDIGAADEIHGDGGDDFIWGMAGNDVLFGDAQNDAIIGGYGGDWISGGTGDDGILGDDGSLRISRNSSTVGEALYGIAAIPAGELNQLVATNNTIQNAILNKAGVLKYTADLTPDNLDPAHVAPYTLMPRATFANDVIYGGFGDDSIHGGAGEDALSGAEAPGLAYTNNYTVSGVLVGTPVESDWSHPYNPGNALGYIPTGPNATKFALYDSAKDEGLRKILLTGAGALSKTGSGLEWLLNFDDTEGPLDTKWAPGNGGYPAKPTDGDDRLFGDLGHDWIVGGTGRDSAWGGWGDDLMNLDDVLGTNGGLNSGTDTNPSWEDLTYGGAGRDVMILNTAGDRANDWVGEFDSFWTPFNAFGSVAVNRLYQPDLRDYLLAVSKSQGADPTLTAQYGGDPLRNGEPFGELGMVQNQDAAWQDQTGAPRDPQAGNGKAKADVAKTSNSQPIYETAITAGATSLPVLLTQGELVTAAAEARVLWTQALGAGDARLTILDGVTVEIGNLGADKLGVTIGREIYIDGNAAGYGWSFGGSNGSVAPGRMDLLTVVAHELGNAMGFDEDAHETSTVTSPILRAGDRHLPGAVARGFVADTGTGVERARVDAIDWNGRAHFDSLAPGRDDARWTGSRSSAFWVIDGRQREEIETSWSLAAWRHAGETTAGARTVVEWNAETDLQTELVAATSAEVSPEV